MSAVDDPTIPEELGDLLRIAAAHQEVSPAPLQAVERRVHVRRRRRRGTIGCGAAAIVLLAALATAQVTGDDSQQVVTATEPAAIEGSAPQPVLVPRLRLASQLPAGVDPEAAGGILDSITATDTTAWWTTEGIWYPTSASVLADGRRFGLAVTSAVARTEDQYLGARLDRIGDDGRTASSQTVSMDVPDGEHGWIRSIGATGNEVILQRGLQKVPEVFDQEAPGGMVIEESTRFSALDVDTGAERPIADVEGSPQASAAGDVLVYGPGTDCTLAVVPLDGGDTRTLGGTCEGQVDGLSGLVLRVAVSPDGRYAGVVWNSIHPIGDPIQTLEVIDLQAGRTVQHQNLSAQALVNAMAWTSEHGLTVAMEPQGEPITLDGGGVTVRTIAWSSLTPVSGD